MDCPDPNKTDKKSRAAQIFEDDEDGSKQSTKISKYSPCEVKNCELLARSLDFPSKFEAAGGLNELLFQDAFSIGASVQRFPDGWDAHSKIIHERFEKRAADKRNASEDSDPARKAIYVGAYHVNAGELRSCKLDNEDLMRVRVYDAANNPDDPLHADIFVNDSGLKKHERKELRIRLMALAQERGLHVSPYPSDEVVERAKETESILHIESKIEMSQYAETTGEKCGE